MLSIYLIIGAIAGLMSGLFGVGGGVVVIPAFSTVFSHNTAIPPDYLMQIAVGTSLAIMIVTSLSSLYAHHKRGSVSWDYFWRMVPGLIIGAITGSVVAYFLPSSYLQIIFGIFLIYVGFRMVLSKSATAGGEGVSHRAVKIVSGIIGGLSSILGIGGGALLVPFFLHCQLDMRVATGTSIACGLVVGIVATICFMVVGLLSPVVLSGATGYIYWPAFIGVAIASVLFAPLGAALSHALPKEFLKRIFGIFLLLMAADMLLSR